MSISLSKLDLSFMRKPDPDACKPGRYVMHEGECIPKAQRPRPPAPKRSGIACPYFMPDVDSTYGGAWKSVIDGSEISSRSNWREHDKRNEVVNIGNDFWAKDGDDVRYTEEKMGYDPSLIGAKNTDVEFNWSEPSV